MLETFCENAKSFNSNMTRLMDELNSFKSIIQHTNYLIEDTKTDSAYLYSIKNLKLKLNELQVKTPFFYRPLNQHYLK